MKICVSVVETSLGDIRREKHICLLCDLKFSLYSLLVKAESFSFSSDILCSCRSVFSGCFPPSFQACHLSPGSSDPALIVCSMPSTQSLAREFC